MANFAQTLSDPRTTRKLPQTRIAELLAVTLDELAGQKETQNPRTIRNHELHRLYRRVEIPFDMDQKALLVVLVKGSSTYRVMAQ
jgi:hypothetical protein